MLLSCEIFRMPMQQTCLLVLPYTACILSQRSALLCMHMHFHHLWQGTEQSIPETINPIYSASWKPGHWENKVTLLDESNKWEHFNGSKSAHILFHFLTTTSTLLRTVGHYCNGHHVNLDTESPWQQYKHLLLYPDVEPVTMETWTSNRRKIQCREQTEVS